MESPTLAVLGIGFLLGLQHAIEADHLAAVSTIVSEKKSLATASIVGGLWGVGHTISLFVVGALVILLKLQISEVVEARLEAIVGVMLVLLGLNALRKLFNSHVHAHVHNHGEREHVHFHTHAGESAPESHHRFSVRSILIGMVHGLAGSAALMLLIVPTISSPIVGLLYILTFGIGSIGGMMAMSFLIGLPIHFTADRFDILNKGIRLCAGIFSLSLGAFIIYEKALSV
ncbi:MAG TPA: sulfite exporter TauE/SafE family protein [Pyrinomonadaceae bacterium]|nr:sulfite exporter TauE/SafE family protein [Pyrinomonadaceae bacterium]